MGDRPECRGNDRLVELAGHYLSGFPALPLPQQARGTGELPGSVCSHCSDSVGLAPVACLATVGHPTGPPGPVISHPCSFPGSPSIKCRRSRGGDTQGDTALSPGCPFLPPPLSLAVLHHYSAAPVGSFPAGSGLTTCTLSGRFCCLAVKANRGAIFVYARKLFASETSSVSLLFPVM